VHHERVEVVGQAAGGGGEPALVQVIDERLEPTSGVVFADRVIQRLPVGVLDAFALGVRQLGVEVARAVHTAALPV
jgi:hypothetical protein